MRVLVVDDHEFVRRGVRSLLLSQSNYEVCGEAVDGQDALEKARELKPDVIVMDVSMPKLNGLEATRLIRSMLPDSEVLILSQHESSQMLKEAVKAGARGYVVKSSISKDLLTALADVGQHKPFFDASIPEGANRSGHIDAQEVLQRSAALEQALRESEELYRSTFDLAAVGIAHVSPDGQWLRVNKKLCKIVGYSEEELFEMRFQDITHPDDLGTDVAEAEKVRTGALDTYSTEKRYIRKDGALVWVNLTVSGARHPSGELKHFISVVEDITERKAAEEAQRASEARLELALDASNTALFEWDIEKQTGEWNPQMAAIYAFQPESECITAEEWSGLFHSEDVNRLRADAERFLADTCKKQFDFEFRTSKPDGETKWIRSHGRIVRDVNGKAVRLIGTHTDITDRKRVEQALRESEQRYRTVTDASPVMVWMSGTDRLCYYFNKGWLDFVGRTLEQESGNGWTKNVHPDDFDRCLQMYFTNFDARRPFEMEYRLRHHTGEYRWIFDRGVPRYAPDGTFEGYVGGCLDIHAQKAGAQKVRTADETCA
jgi:PAS domain S-box-containing protein